MAEAFVQVATDGTGKRIRNISMDVLQADGSIATVYLQVAAIRDEKGDPIEFGSMLNVLRAIYQEVKALRMIQGQATGLNQLALAAGVDDQVDATSSS